MNIEISDRPLQWGELDLSMFGITHDWYGKEIVPPITFGCIMDQANLWFVASHQKAPMIHPTARPGTFQEELWQYDVAELFIADPESGHYLELNLAPNGAWWSAEFTAPRVRAEATDIPFPQVATFAEMDKNGSWLAAAALPLKELRERLHFGAESTMNATFILNSPEQQFFSATKLEAPEPDFHLPEQFKKIHFFHNQEAS